MIKFINIIGGLKYNKKKYIEPIIIEVSLNISVIHIFYCKSVQNTHRLKLRQRFQSFA